MRQLPTLFARFWRYLGAPGAIYPLGADSVEYELAPPADYADNDYALFVDRLTGLPVWRKVTDLTIASGGFGSSFGGGFGES